MGGVDWEPGAHSPPAARASQTVNFASCSRHNGKLSVALARRGRPYHQACRRRAYPARSTASLAPTRSSSRMTASSAGVGAGRSEEHTSELQSLTNLVCRLLLEKKK